MTSKHTETVRGVSLVPWVDWRVISMATPTLLGSHGTAGIPMYCRAPTYTIPSGSCCTARRPLYLPGSDCTAGLPLYPTLLPSHTPALRLSCPPTPRCKLTHLLDDDWLAVLTFSRREPSDHPTDYRKENHRNRYRGDHNYSEFSSLPLTTPFVFYPRRLLYFHRFHGFCKKESITSFSWDSAHYENELLT